ncbi:MAG: hypothetical protein QOH71_131 [Blastocatellia bacterium]|nr:hypothetical protein [Blastocatellia bacterium]
MKLINIKNLGGAILGLVMLLGVGVMSSTTTQAQYYPNQDQYRRQREIQRQAEVQRQYEIQRQAEIERQRQQQNGQWGNDQWNRNNQGYNRQGQGRRGRNWDGYGNQGGSYELRQTALNAGYNEGNKAGRNDRRSGRYDPTRSSAYRNAMKDYNSRMGDRYAYQQYFRAAFENGYSDGYNGY